MNGNVVFPNVWGEGQLFVFSALDGDSFQTNDFAGMLSKDRLGVRFYTSVIRELTFKDAFCQNLVFKAVTGDYICAKTQSGNIKVIFQDTHLIIGEFSKGNEPFVLTEGECKREKFDNVEIQDTLDGAFTALGVEGNKFAFAYGFTVDKVKELVEKGLKEEISVAERKKISFYEKHSRADLGNYGLLYSKFLSVMKTQLYSPEKPFDCIWSTPDRLPHRDLWLWDSVFHAIGWRHVDTKVAESLILAVLSTQKENGMIPHQTGTTFQSNISQPPVIAWGSWLVYQKTGNINFLKTVYEKNLQFLKWVYSAKKIENEDLFIWNTHDDKSCRCGESGADNSPRFDDFVTLLAIDLSCYVANEMRYMSKIGKVLGEETAWFDGCFKRIKEAVNRKLWDEDTRFYYDFDITNNRIQRVASVASFLPLFSGICDEVKAEMLVEHLENPNEFYTAFPVPSISASDKRYAKDMWRGPVWINLNYMIILGLRENGFTEFADALEIKTIDVINEWYLKTGTVFEFYDSENKTPPYELDRKGPVTKDYDIRKKYQSIRDYGWSCTLTLDMLENL